MTKAELMELLNTQESVLQMLLSPEREMHLMQQQRIVEAAKHFIKVYTETRIPDKEWHKLTIHAVSRLKKEIDEEI